MSDKEREYLTDSIFLCNGQLFCEENNKIKEIKNHNWHHKLYEYGWEKLNKQWIKKLNNYQEYPSKNSLYGSLDCGGEGECLFHCLSYALNGDNNPRSLREGLSESITKERFQIIIEFYQVMDSINEFEEDWDPNEISYEDFKKKVKNGGNEYWGDFLLLNLLKEYLNINFIVLNSNDLTNEYYYYPIFYEYNENIKTIILLYENGIHFKLVGKFQGGNMTTLFTKETIPNEILKLINFLR
tara:strand:+ start:8297 stop:9019 length:723 start_codon:yes stop_codon:yes gene_type:complete